MGDKIRVMYSEEEDGSHDLCIKGRRIFYV